MTYTYVSYWTPEDLGPLYEEIQKLKDEFEKRKSYCHPNAAEAMENRLVALTTAAAIMAEPVPKLYGG